MSSVSELISIIIFSFVSHLVYVSDEENIFHDSLSATGFVDFTSLLYIATVFQRVKLRKPTYVYTFSHFIFREIIQLILSESIFLTNSFANDSQSMWWNEKSFCYIRRPNK